MTTPIQHPPLILASASPRRKELLAQIHVTPTHIIPADIDETIHSGERPRPYAERLAREKAAKIAADYATDHAGAVILAADTVVSMGNRLLDKATDEQSGRKYLSALSGRKHTVTTGISLITADGTQLTKSVKSSVSFKILSPQDIDSYIRSGEYLGKAGGYAIQGIGSRFIRSISGSYSTIVGLPLFEVSGWLEAHWPPYHQQLYAVSGE